MHTETISLRQSLAKAKYTEDFVSVTSDIFLFSKSEEAKKWFLFQEKTF